MTEYKTVCAKCGGAGKYKPSESFDTEVDCSCVSNLNLNKELRDVLWLIDPLGGVTSSKVDQAYYRLLKIIDKL